MTRLYMLTFQVCFTYGHNILMQCTPEDGQVPDQNMSGLM
jgi:hypothetical protein